MWCIKVTFLTEQEADAEVERQRREREDQQKEQEMTLEETKEQVAQSESRLSQLKEDKHQLFLQLKKVLNEDDTRRKIKESSFKYVFHFDISCYKFNSEFKLKYFLQ
jgi:hypothetical protein